MPFRKRDRRAPAPIRPEHTVETGIAQQPPALDAPPTRAGRTVPLHPFLVAAFPILALYATNVGRIPIEQIARPLGYALLGTIALWAVLALWMRDIGRAAILASAAALAFFSYGHAAHLLPAPLRPALLPALAILLVLLAMALRRNPALSRATGRLNLVSLALIAPSCWTIGAGMRAGTERAEFVPHLVRTHRQIAALAPKHRRVAAVARADQPDIYYIILDAYARADSLKAFYGYDNTPFLRALQERGFYIASRAHSNYDQTGLCLASAINMTYLDALADQLGRDETSLDPCRRLLDDNAVAAFLAKRGYHYVYIWSGEGNTRVETADLVLQRKPKTSAFEGQVMGMTALDAAPETEQATYDEHRAQLLGAFQNLNTVARLPYPKFVFAHISAPHPPFVFGASGEPVDPKGPFTPSDGSWLLRQMTREEYRRGYTAQLSYINQRTLQAIDAILRESRRAPVILIQGDHGSRMNLDWDSQARTDLREPFSILSAYHAPRSVRTRLYDGITPVNSFRVVLNQLFNARFPLLPDRTFYSTVGRPYDFSDVTQLLPDTIDAPHD